MQNTALYEHLLGIKSPWQVKAVDLSVADQRIGIDVELKRDQVWADPTDATKRAHICSSFILITMPHIMIDHGYLFRLKPHWTMPHADDQPKTA